MNNQSICSEYCEGCYYLGWSGNNRCCNFILIECQMRGCPAGDGCTKKKKWNERKTSDAWMPFAEKRDLISKGFIKPVEHIEKPKEPPKPEKPKITISASDGTTIVLPEKNMTKWNEKLALELNQKGLTAREIAEQVGTTERAIQRWRSRRGIRSTRSEKNG